MGSMTLKTLLGDDLPIIVEFEHQPYEASTLEYEGVGESVDIEVIRVGEHDITEQVSATVYRELEEQCLESVHEN